MKIRKATLEDAESLSALNVDVQKIHADALPKIFKQPSNDLFAVDFMRERLTELFNYFFIASENGKDVGYIYARIIDRPENPFTFAWKYLYIDQFSVSPEFQRKGCGKLLLSEIYKLARENRIETIALDTWSFNEQALAFFRKQGFATFNQRMWHSLIL